MKDFFDADIRTTPQPLDLGDCDDLGYYLGDKEMKNGLRLGFFHFQIKSGNVLRKRVGLRNLVKPFLKYDVDAAIVVFSDLEHWRLSFISDFGKNATAPKRFTYVFGNPTQFYNTPVKRLYELQGKELSMESLYETFSVESLSDEFFDDYKKLYEKLCHFVYEHKSDAAYFGAEFADWEDKAIRDYVKKLMGRLVFLQFVQKKGWLGDNANYLRKLFNSSPCQEDFLDKVLEPLFFGIFNTQKESRREIFHNEGWDLALLDEWQSVPFLSGGLFERDKHDVPASRFPKEYFKELFDFFARYNFTIDENDPNDAEVGVDPEMLGKIFENLLEDNKDKGAYYTPKEIVRYMSCESVIQYLKSHTDESLHADIELLVNHNELGDAIKEMKNAKLVGQLLKKVKVCDPAIGSGAFPMGVLNVIFNCRRTMLEELTAERFDDYVRVKKEIIQNNIYGVDIEQGAVDIARLRFWLALLVDAKEPEALPNLNYKIMRGNSLIPTFDGQYINLEVQGLQDKAKQQRLQELLELQGSYYALVGDEKCKAEIRIKQLVLDIVALQISKELRAWEEKNAVQGDIFEPRNMEDLKKILPEEKLNVLRKGQGIRDRLNDESISLQERANTDLDFFDWHIMFSDVFENNGGFDIVIGNPPYVQIPKHLHPVSIFPYSEGKDKGKQNLYKLFIEHSYNLSKECGTAALIVQSSIMCDASAQYTRELLLTKTQIKQVIEFPKIAPHKEGQLFKTALVATAIVIFDKCLPSSDSNFLVSAHNDLTTLRNFDFAVIDQREPIRFYPQGFCFPLIRDKDFSIVRKMNTNMVRLSSMLAEKSQGDFNLTTERSCFSTDYSEVKMYRGCHVHRYYIDKEVEEFIKDRYKNTSIRSNAEKVWLVCQNISGMNDKNRFNMSISTGVECLFGHSVDKIRLKDESLSKYVLAIINSKLMDWYFRKTSTNNHVNVYELEQLPIPFPVSSDEMLLSREPEIVALVDRILAAKKDCPQAVTTAEEREIDRLVYDLYGLTDEEIDIVEGA